MGLQTTPPALLTKNIGVMGRAGSVPYHNPFHHSILRASCWLLLFCASLLLFDIVDSLPMQHYLFSRTCCSCSILYFRCSCTLLVQH
ncbi:uncharacterized protein EDB91DRAFT_1178676 [Suillus paluster]|uniref:uncharacterized protein n=1 Tax=Suillus paluster TaxID=48578 RepID=UPI001B886507|nr:uncharacterized protein EDB91DRAFT_1178676 [Suillus paluster]KAG1720061.1 hypothetical protein EDB91DRAFT_1178676 [Suillus paluster]